MSLGGELVIFRKFIKFTKFILEQFRVFKSNAEVSRNAFGNSRARLAKYFLPTFMTFIQPFLSLA